MEKINNVCQEGQQFFSILGAINMNYMFFLMNG